MTFFPADLFRVKISIYLKKNPPKVLVKSGQKLFPRLFALYCKLLCDSLKYQATQKCRKHILKFV